MCHEFHDLNEAWPEACAGHFGHRGDDAGLYVISDSMDPIRSMADGRMYDSKSAYRRELRARGCYELGNDSVSRAASPRPPVRETLRQTLQQLKGC
ncbi:hypothetical protein DJ017_19815 [Phenylobacterium soli]|uniref:Uncharacterized protein n=1 Tax=Phenylobacterium soli TaxID=2170551 RepID=A0A328AAJ3_9CAUL|nr:hypothetical protein DJ017_19815 [Phenylobacterium soli]